MSCSKAAGEFILSIVGLIKIVKCFSVSIVIIDFCFEFRNYCGYLFPILYYVVFLAVSSRFRWYWRYHDSDAWVPHYFRQKSFKKWQLTFFLCPMWWIIHGFVVQTPIASNYDLTIVSFLFYIILYDGRERSTCGSKLHQFQRMKSLKSFLWSVKLAESPWNVPMPKAQLLASPYLSYQSSFRPRTWSRHDYPASINKG